MINNNIFNNLNEKEHDRLKKRSSILQNEAVKISSIYSVFGILWILLSDTLLEHIIPDIELYKHLQTYKGWFYILITTLMVYLLIRSKILLLKNENVKTIRAYEELSAAHDELKKTKADLVHLAFYDSLTGLPNRAMFEEEINKHLGLRLPGDHFMIAYIDIDNFKNINDSMGHQVGDLFLADLGDRLKAEVKEPSIVARLGGDEFAILFLALDREEVIEQIETIRQRVSKTWTVENHQFYISMSIGVVEYPSDGVSSTALLKNADIAMYSAKREGKNRVLLFKDEINDSNSKHLRMINNLQYGIDEEQFVLYYQPQFDLKTGNIIGVEALVRWIHPQEGFISPSEFIPLAEESGQIFKLERWIIAKALEQKKQWEEQGFHNLILSVNLSGKTLTSYINFQEIEKIIAKSPVNFEKIIIEITETASISDMGIVIKHLNNLRKLGIRIALDDFGTGYSSLNYLKMFPINIIKLDRSFINAINENGVDMLLIKNILMLAHDLEFEVVAEGIESREQLEFLKNYYCEAGQGYLFSKPLPIEKMNELMSKPYSIAAL